VADAPDPLGKRALFWAPAERQDEGPRYPDEGDVPGKHALYSATGSAASPGLRPRRRPTGPDDAGPGRTSHPSNRPPSGAERSRSTGGRSTVTHRDVGTSDDLERPPSSGMFGSLTLHCSSCRVRSQVDLVEFVVLHLPLWFWRPGRGYTQFMSCPACRRRTWVSASWTSWAR
jgi:hypothetical protein